MNNLTKVFLQQQGWSELRRRAVSVHQTRLLMSTLTAKTEKVVLPKKKFTNQEALDYHQFPEPGKFSIHPTKPMAN